MRARPILRSFIVFMLSCLTGTYALLFLMWLSMPGACLAETGQIGPFATRMDYPIGVDAVKVLAADVDKDGDLDLVVGRR
jgi:hypothetical protein